MPVSKAVDGSKDTSTQYGEFGKDNVAKSAYLEVDLGEVASIDRINMVRYYNDGRTYRNTTIVLSEDETFDAKDTVVYNSDAENLNGFGKGSDAAYAESGAGRSFDVKEDTRARFARVYMNGQNDTDKTTNHVVELEVMGTRDVRLNDPYGVAALDALIARGKAAVESGSYTEESVKALEAPLAAAKELSAKVHKEIEAQQFSLTFGEFNAVKSDLQSALAALELKPGAPEPQPPVDPNPPVDPEPEQPGNPDGGQDGGPVKPGPEQPKPGAGGQSDSSLPTTGDSTLFVVAGAALVGAGIFGIGLYLKRRGC